MTPLGAFLRTRREAAAPYAAGETPKRRKTSGLRREEVAVLAGVSANYYTRLEQGRERRPSAQVLHAISRALDLDSASRDHLFDLAESVEARPGVPGSPGGERVPPELSRLVESQLRGPALVVGPWGDILGGNAAGAVLYGASGHHRNMILSVFLDPRARSFYADWESAARCSAGVLRTAYGKNPRSARFAEIFQELSARSPDFHRIWNEHPVTRKTGGNKRLHHESAGPLELTYQLFEIPQAPGLQVLMYQSGARSTEDAYRRLLALADTSVASEQSLAGAVAGSSVR
ncbi:helix-turn-helix transcriptional regulator [Streptomyces sp. AK02-01A]|uniref:helix-turn-helix transcriptional regulator n=1 Tax=Streptomyces sp. AK02-01A TaxID=3028648 RepID=UPI0029B290B7|nr:helix-turn-helix transcriptional regulator [Streptomyces sp. AK02-01A]MDX3852369.1 helix-turn-helix transcriptional regulator [Streptomyces sp. AK02-01A]